jgi:murein DD-endopeptidase MepM/ murein hydrolase activator NlpD
MRTNETGASGDENSHRATVEMSDRGGKTRTTAGVLFLAVLICVLAFGATLLVRLWPELRPRPPLDPGLRLVSPLELASLPTARRFDFPIGTEHGAMSYNAQPFTENRHLGDDLNGIGGENSDLGDPVFAVADGRVLLARECGRGWGNVVIVLHAYSEKDSRHYIQSYYGHVDEMLVRPGEEIRRGQRIATVGTANGAYWAHLHFEMREFVTPFIGPGYRQETRGWVNPTAFILAHRGGADDDVGRSTATIP